MKTFEEAAEMGIRTNQFHYITAPLNSNPEKKITIELLRLKNAEMMARLPGPVYNVIASKPSLREGNLWVTVKGAAALEEMDVEGCFPTTDAAETFASQLLGEKLSEYPNGRVVYNGQRAPALRFDGFIVGRDNAGKERIELTVSVEYDSGEILY